MRTGHKKSRALSLFGISALGIWTICGASTAVADDVVVRVEEDWILVLNVPGTGLDSPQFHTTMSPTGNVDGYFAQVTWNYRTWPDFDSGGLQLHCWNGETEVRNRKVGDQQLSTTAETITWTQVLSTDGSTLSFEIANGQSTTWGTFGKDMKIDEDASLSDLSAYSTSVSVNNACVTYGSNRVNALVIAGVRRYNADGELLSTDSTPYVVSQMSDEGSGE